MSLLNQKTIKNTVTFQGIGLHSGKLVNVSLKSASPDTGIVFQRIDLKTDNLVYPNFANVSNTSLNTTISNQQGIRVSTIEHLMGALFGLGIDNVLIEIDNEEVPILDGSAKKFIEKILEAGVEVSNSPIKIIKINKKIEFKEGDRFISIEPSKLSLDIDFELKYKNNLIGNQRNKINVYEDDLNEIFNSRTFCLYEDIEAIKKVGLAKGGSLENAIVVKGNDILNQEGLRTINEPAKHKALDAVGDLFLAGNCVMAHIEASCAGHSLMHAALHEIFSDPSNWKIITLSEKTDYTILSGELSVSTANL